jgi:tetratricopeptide (TPR) repeat protein
MKLTKRDFILLLVIIYFTFIGGTFYSQLNFPLRPANQLIVTAVLGIWLLNKLKHKTGLPATPLDWGIGLYLVANLVSALLGQSPRYSLESMWFTVTHILAFYLLVDLARRGWTTGLVWAFYMASAVVCLVSLIEFIAWYVGTPLFANFAQGWLEIGGWRQPIPPKFYRLGAAMNGPTPLSAYLALLTPPAIALILTLPARNENRKALIIWLVLALIVQILTFSRAGILALAVSLSLFAIGWQQVTNRAWLNLGRSWSRLGLLYQSALIAGGFLAATLGFLWLRNSFLNRAHSTSFRLILWDAATAIFQEHWLTGAGPANFGRALLRLNDPALPRLQIGTAHSIYFNTAAELGLLGLLVGACLYLMLAWSWRQRWRQAASPTEQLRLIGCGAALVGLAAQTLVDTYLATPNMLIMLAIIVYIVADLKIPLFQQPVYSKIQNPKSKIQNLKSKIPLCLGYGAAAALFVYLLGLSWVARADFHFWNSFRQENRGNLVEAVNQAVQARNLDPDLALRTFRLALLEARLADQAGDSAWGQAAITDYQSGLLQEPILGLNSANLAGLLWRQGQRAEAIELLERTIEVEPDPIYLINLGYFYEQEGDWSGAIQQYGQALNRSPRLASSGFWQAASGRAERWPAFVEAAVTQIPAEQSQAQASLRLNLALNREEFDRAETLIQVESPVTDAADDIYRALIADFYLNRAQPEQAQAILDQGTNTAQTYLLQGRIELQAGHAADAEKLLKTAIFLGSQEANYYLGQLFEQRGDLQAAAAAYGRGFAYRAIQEDIAVNIYGRLGGHDLAPQLLRIGIGQAQAKPLLALARLREDEQRFEEAKQIYRLLLSEDPFFELAQHRLELLEEKGL